MRKTYKDLQKARRRRDRIRREKHVQRFGPPPARESVPSHFSAHPFAMERSMLEIHALMEGHKFTSTDEINAKLAELTAGGRISQMANTWKQDDPKWRAQQLAYDALETDDIDDAMRLVNEALEVDPDCTDAERLRISILPMTPGNRLPLMREVAQKAERNLGESYIEEHTGNFWKSISTRPYMRTMQHIGELLTETGDLRGAIVVFERMIELNAGDNQGMRYPLLGLYLATRQPEAASGLISRFPGEENFSAAFSWGRVLERWISGAFPEAEAALATARKINPFVERYLTGVREMPRRAPEFYGHGDDSEAQVCVRELVLAWMSHPDFRDWLRSRR